MKQVIFTGLIAATFAFTPAAFSDDAAIVDVETSIVEPSSISEEVRSHVESASDKLLTASRNILAGSGHRDTYKGRQLISARTMELSSAVRSKLKTLTKAEARYTSSSANQAEVLNEVEALLLLKQTEIQYMLSELQTDDEPEYYKSNVYLLEGAVEDIDNALNALIETRSLSLKAVFSNLEGEEIALLAGRLASLVDGGELTSRGEETDEGYVVYISGSVPAGWPAKFIEDSFVRLLQTPPEIEGDNTPELQVVLSRLMITLE